MTDAAFVADRRARLAALAACLSTTIGGAGVVAMRIGVGETDPVTVAFLRNAIGALILVPTALVFVRAWPRGWDRLIAAAVGLLFFGVFQWMVTAGLQFTTAGRAGIAMATMPFLTMVIAAAFAIERLTVRKGLGVLVATFGVGAALWQDAGSVPGAWRGDLFVLGAAVLGGVGNVFFSVYAKRYEALAIVTYGVLPALVFLWVAAQVSGAPTVAPALSATGWIAIAYVGIVAAGGSYFLWLWALQYTTPTLVSVAVTLNPVSALLFGALILAEPVTIGLVAGLACVIVGILIVNWRRT